MASVIEKVNKTKFKNKNLGLSNLIKYQGDPFHTVVKFDSDKSSLMFYMSHAVISLPIDQVKHMDSKAHVNDLENALKEFKNNKTHTFYELSGQLIYEAIQVKEVSETLAKQVLDAIESKANKLTTSNLGGIA